VSLTQAGARILAACRDGLGDTLPARNYVTIGDPAFDCDQQLVVSFARAAYGFPGDETSASSPCAYPLVSVWNVWLTACAGASDPLPASDDLTAAAVDILGDAYVLWDYLGSLAATDDAGLNLSGLPSAQCTITPLEAREVEGNVAAVVFTVSVPLL
jgi:hypothetical protein